MMGVLPTQKNHQVPKLNLWNQRICNPDIGKDQYPDFLLFLQRSFQATISFREGIRRTLEWFAADEKRQRIDEKVNAEMDQIIKAYNELYRGI